MKNADMPAMPGKAEVSNTDEAFAYQFDHGSKFQFPGLTKREIFAMHAMQGELAGSANHSRPDPEDVAHFAAKCADALLKELDK